MDELQTNSSFPLSLNHIVWTVKRRKWAILASIFLGLAAAKAFVTVIPPKYAASSQIMFDTVTEELVNTDQELRGRWTGQHAFASAVAMIGSPGILKPVAMKIMSEPERPLTPTTPIQKILAKAGLTTEERTAALIKTLEKSLSVTTPTADQVVVIEYKSSSASEAAYVANLVAATFLEQRAQSRKESLAQATAWLDDRSLEAKNKLTALDQKIQNFKAVNRIENERGSSALEAELTQERNQLSAVQTRLLDARTVYETMNAHPNQSAGENERLAARVTDPALERLRTSLTDAEGALARAKGRFGESHPEVRAQRSQVAAIKADIAAETRQRQLATKMEVEQLTTREGVLLENVKNLESKVRDLRAAEVQLLELQREREATKTLYDAMLAKLMQTSMQQTLTFGQFKVVLTATLPKNPKIPAELFLAAGAIFGLGAGLFLSLLLEILQGRVVIPDDIGRRLSTTLISRIPLISKKDFNGRMPDGAVSYKCFAKDFPESLFANELFSAQRAASALAADKKCRIIMITSPVAGNGKTHISSNLASLSKFIGKKTLLIDLDARKSDKIGAGTDEPNCSALNLFLKEHELEDVFTAYHRTGTGDYDVLQVRPSNEAACLRFFHTQAEDLLKFVRQNYDHAWIDTPPVRIFNDPLIIAGQVDGVMVVAEWCKTTVKQLKETINLVEGGGGSVLGVILNKVQINSLISESMVSYGNYYSNRKSSSRSSKR